MSIYRIRLSKGGHSIRAVEVGTYPLMLGSSEDAHIVVPDAEVAGHYARIFMAEGKLHIHAMNPDRVVEVNGLHTHSSSLSETDRVRVGDYVLTVERIAAEGGVLGPETSQISPEAATRLSDRIITTRDAAAIGVLYQCAQNLARAEVLDQAIREVLDCLYEELDVPRSAVFQCHAGDSETVLLACNTAMSQATESLPLSNTLISYVLQSGSAVLTKNALEDSRFNAAQSIMQNRINAVICAPLAGRHQTYGVLYADSNNTELVFSETQLQVLTVVGQIIGTALENAQLSEKRLQQERLAALGEAIAGTSHCMRNLLTGMSVSVEMLEEARQKQSWDAFDRSIFTLKRSVGRFADQVNNMLGWSRETELHLAPVNVNEVVAEALHEVEPLVHRHRIQIMFKRGALDSIPLDGAMIHRVLLNLLSNAIEACGTQGGSVTVSTFQNEIFTRFSVTDTGSGVLPEHQERIFEAFFTTKGGGGTGLGLAVSRRMIREHGGDIRVSSKPGEGARFSVVLPHKLLQERFARQVASRPSERKAK